MMNITGAEIIVGIMIGIVQAMVVMTIGIDVVVIMGLTIDGIVTIVMLAVMNAIDVMRDHPLDAVSRYSIISVV